MTNIQDLFSVDRLRPLGMQRREVQCDIAQDLETILQAPLPPAKTVTTRDGQKTRQQAACGLVQAAPGTGKTVAALVAAIRHCHRTGERVAISTYTRALQRQILNDGDIERAKALTGQEVAVAVRVGRANFISRSRVEAYDALFRQEGVDNAFWREFVSWVRSWTPRTLPLDTTFMAWRDQFESLPEVDGHNLTEDMLSIGQESTKGGAPEDDPDEKQADLEGLVPEDDAIADARQQEKLAPADEDKKDLFYYRHHAEYAKECDIVITNHATIALHAQSRGAILGNIEAVIFDETDRLPDAIRSLYSHRMRPHLLLNTCERRRGRRVPKRQRQIASAIDVCLQEIGEIFDRRDVTPARLKESAPAHWQRLADLLDAFRVRGCSSDLRGLRLVKEAFKESGRKSGSGIVYLSFSPIRKYPALCVDPDPVDVRNLLARLITSFTPVDAQQSPAANVAPADPDVAAEVADEEIEDLPFAGFRHAAYISASLVNPIDRDPMAHVHHEYGIDTASLVKASQHEPPVFGSMRFVLSDPSVKKPFLDRDKDADGEGQQGLPYNPAWLDYIRRAIDHDPKRRKLVLTPSFLDVRELLARRGVSLSDGETSRSVILDGVLYHLPGDPSHQVATHVRRDDVRAIITPSLWEGANLVVDRDDGRRIVWMQDLIITRLPVPPSPPDIVQNRMVRAILANPKKTIRTREYALGLLLRQRATQSLRKLLQGIGRGVRGPDDAIRIWLLDPRLELPAAWAERVQEALYDQDASDTLTLPLDRQSFPAHKHWINVIPRRFQSQIEQSAFFAQSGRLWTWADITHKGVVA